MLLLGLEIAVPVLVGVGVKMFNNWIKKQELHRVRTEMVRVVNDACDMDDTSEMLKVKASTVRLKKRLRYHGMPAIIKSIQYAEMKVGLLTNTVANKMVVEKIIRDFMITPIKDGGLGMRICDAVKNYRVAVTMYFLPRHQATICEEISKLKVNEVREAEAFLGLDGSY
jgi:hypothetical protein